MNLELLAHYNSKAPIATLRVATFRDWRLGIATIPSRDLFVALRLPGHPRYILTRSNPVIYNLRSPITVRTGLDGARHAAVSWAEIVIAAQQIETWVAQQSSVRPGASVAAEHRVDQ